MTSDGTCRFVMPRSESTIARRGPAAIPASTAALIASPSGSFAAASSSAPRPSLGLMSAAAKTSPNSSNTAGRNARTTWPKMIGSETFIIVALRCTENRTSSAAARAIWASRNSCSAATCIAVASTISPASTGTDSRSTVDEPSAASSWMRRLPSAVDDDRLLVGAEVVRRHVGDVRLGVRAPRAHRVRVLAGVLLDRERRAAVGVALAEHRVDGRPHDPVVAGPDVALVVGLRVVRVARDVVALCLQLGDGRLQLGDRRRDVRQLDDVRLWSRGQIAELRERVADALVVTEPLGEQRQDAPGQRDVARLDRHAGDPGVRLDDRQERIRRQQGRLIGVRVDDGG